MSSHILFIGVQSRAKLFTSNYQMERWIGKIAVVTGASSGIAAKTAVDLANIGVIVIGLARRPERIEALKSQVHGKFKVFARKCDVTNNEEVKATFEWIKDKFGGVDILVNCAGVGVLGDLVDPTKLDEYVRMINTDLLGPVYCVQEAFKSMKDRDVHGHIILMNCGLGHSIPNLPISLNITPPVKFAITAMTEVLRQEFERLHSKVRVTSISPGLVDTPMVKDFKVLYPQIKLLQPEDISDAVKYVLSAPPRVKIHELTLKR